MNRSLPMAMIVLAAWVHGPWAQAQILSSESHSELDVESSQASCGVPRYRPTMGLPEALYNRLSDLYELTAEERYEEAYAGFEQILPRVERAPFEQAVVLHAMGNVRLSQDRTEDALKHYRHAVALDALGNPQHFEIILLMANLYYSLEQFDLSLKQLEQWFCFRPPEQPGEVDAWVMKAGIHAALEEWREALTAIDRAILLADEPREQWFQLKSSMLIELAEYGDAIDVLKILIDMSPEKKIYWIQMSALYAQLGNDDQSRASLHVAFRKGLLDRSAEFVQLASLLQAHDSPRQAAEVMEHGLAAGFIDDNRRNWEMTGGAWFQARELDKALVAYQKAGAHGEDGKIDLQRGFLLIDLERWSEGIDALTRALELSGLSDGDTGNAHLLLGIAHANLGNVDQAQQAFNRAQNYRRVSQAAREWINHLREQRNRYTNR